MTIKIKMKHANKFSFFQTALARIGSPEQQDD